MCITRNCRTSFLHLLICLLFLTICPLISFSAVEAETSHYRAFTNATKMEVMPIGFVKAPAKILIERRWLANFE